MRAAGMTTAQIAKALGHTLSGTEYQFKRFRRQVAG
jgi:hypothetical protein